TFYALLSTEARPEVVAHVCDDIACGPDLMAALGDRDDVVASPCLGQCDRRPAAYVQRAGRPDSVVLAATLADVDAAVGGASPNFPEPFIAPGPLLARVGVVDPTSLDDYRGHGGYAALAAALRTGPEAVIEEITASNLRGRGGAAFPTGVKWDGARRQPGPRYV